MMTPQTVLGYINGTVEAGPKLYEQINEEFYDQMQPITSTKPYLIVAGNHEANCDNGGYGGKNGYPKYNESICPEGLTNFTGYKNHWKMPSDVSGGEGNFWYSFDYGMVRYVLPVMPSTSLNWKVSTDSLPDVRHRDGSR